MSIQIVLLQKWIKERRGRLPLMAKLINRDADDLYRLIHSNRVSKDLFKIINHKMIEIEKLERECLNYFPHFRRFVKKGDGRGRDLRAVLRERGIHVGKYEIQSMSSAKGDSRLRLLKYGVQEFKDAIRQVEADRRRYVVGSDSLKELISQNLKRRKYNLDGIQNIAKELKMHAEMGDQSSAVVFRRMGDDHLKIVACGVDAYSDDMCKSHVCTPDNPYLHAAMGAALGLRRISTNEVHPLEIFSQITPCVNCCKRLVNSGITAVYALFEPNEPGTAEFLAEHNIPLFKLNLSNKKFIQIN